MANETFVRPEDLERIAAWQNRIGQPYDFQAEATRINDGLPQVYRAEADDLLDALTKKLGFEVIYDLEDPAEFNLTLDPFVLEIEGVLDRTVLRMPLNDLDFIFSYRNLRDISERQLPYYIYNRHFSPGLIRPNTRATLRNLSGDDIFDANLSGQGRRIEFAEQLESGPISATMNTNFGNGLVNYGFFVTNPDVFEDDAEIELYLPNNRAITQGSMFKFLEWNADSVGMSDQERAQHALNLSAGFNLIRIYNFKKRSIPFSGDPSDEYSEDK